MAELDAFTFYRGRVAQAAILGALGVSSGDEVAIQAFTCSAVPEGILSLGARPLYIDVSPGGCTMDPGDLSARLTPRTRAIIVQHTFGIPANLAPILAIAKARNLPVIEDCAHAIGSTIDGMEVGAAGVAAFYSFEASKPIFAGIGGSARVNDPALAGAMGERYSRFHPPSALKQAQIAAMYLAFRIAYRPATFWTVRSWYRSVIRLGLIPGAYHKVSVAEEARPLDEFQLKLGGLQRSLVRRQIADLPSSIAHRRRVASDYQRLIVGPAAKALAVPPGADPVYGRFPLLTPRKAELLARAPDYRVELSDWYATPVHPLTGAALEAAGYRPGSCPNAERQTGEIVSLPTGPLVDQAQIERAARLFNS